MATVLSIIDERGQMILNLRYGLLDGKERTLREVGDILGVSKSAIGQKEQKTLRKLRKLESTYHLKDYLE